MPIVRDAAAACTAALLAGPTQFTAEQLAALIECLPPPRDLKEAEDDEERQQIKTLGSAQGRLQEMRDAGGDGTVVLSIDEVEALIDCLPPPSGAGPVSEVRTKLSELQRSLQA